MSGGGPGPAGPRARRPLLATLVATATLMLITLTRGAGSAGSSVPGSPENVTVVFLNATSVKVTWDTSLGHAEKYDVVYKPTDASLPGHECYRVVAVVAGNTGAVTLEGLQADRQYQVSVAAVRAGRKFRSRPVVFRTLAPPTPGLQPPYPRSNLSPAGGRMVAATGGTFQVRGIEVCIVLLVLAVWAGAIALFFNRWGKIRMLLPYQPDYKEQMKAAAAAAAAGGPPGPGGAPVGQGGLLPPGALGASLAPGGQPSSISCPQAAAGQSCSQHLHWSRLASSARFDYLPPAGARFSRPRINSVFAAYGASSHAGGATGGSSWGGLNYGYGGGMGARGDYGGSRYGGVGAASSGGPYGGLYFAASTEFPACRKARSAENIPMGPLVVLPTPPGDGEGGSPDHGADGEKVDGGKEREYTPPGKEEEEGETAKETSLKTRSVRGPE
ncbi:uncharacterized protein [Hetaerina americana]|uniref:uncharacterized protein n=1 Tax=Hetaerina americana TaxID=62018 RepID=UPI003A7F3B12